MSREWENMIQQSITPRQFPDDDPVEETEMESLRKEKIKEVAEETPNEKT